MTNDNISTQTLVIFFIVVFLTLFCAMIRLVRNRLRQAEQSRTRAQRNIFIANIQIRARQNEADSHSIFPAEHNAPPPYAVVSELPPTYDEVISSASLARIKVEH